MNLNNKVYFGIQVNSYDETIIYLFIFYFLLFLFFLIMYFINRNDNKFIKKNKIDGLYGFKKGGNKKF